MTAQDQILRTKSIKSKAEKQCVSPQFRFCGEREATINHVAQCKMLG